MIHKLTETETAMLTSRLEWLKQIGRAVLVLAFGFMPANMQGQTVKDVFIFTGAGSSGNPGYGAPILGRDAKLYLTTSGPSASNGSVVRVNGSGAGAALHVFDGTDGATPEGGVILASDGSYYGTTEYGGSAGLGVFFRVSSNGIFTVLHEFLGGTDGSVPFAAPVEAADGNLYGTTAQLDGSGFGTVYKYTKSGSFMSLYQFNSSGGQNPASSLIQGADGKLYGTTYYGGAGCGTIFKMTTGGSLLRSYSFACPAYPLGPMVQASDGSFYGTTFAGGSSVEGSIFKMTPSGAVMVVHTFAGGPSDGSLPVGGLSQGTDGLFYGSTQTGGTYGNGTLFRIATDGSGYSLLYSFPSSVGAQPLAAPLQDTSGVFYGTTSLGGSSNLGVVYSLDVGLGPFIALQKYQGKVGNTAQILGQGFTGTTSVTFNGVSATSFQVVSDTYMTAVVPSGATTGNVVVTTPSGALTSNKPFTVTP